MKPLKIKFQERILGLIQGGALGDSYGMATEFMTHQQIKQKYGMIHQLLSSDTQAVISKNCPAGTITDDTFHSLMIFNLLKKNQGKLNPLDYIAELKTWLNTYEYAKNVTGPSTSKALELIEQGVDIHLTGIHGITNGSCMKIAPLGIYTDYRELDKLIQKVTAICLPTHNTPIGICGASIVCALSSYVLRDHHDKDEVKELVTQVIRQFDKKDEHIQHLIKQIDRVYQILDLNLNPESFLETIYQELGCGVEITQSIPAMLAIFLYTFGDPQQSASLAASLGGDTDTMGAIATSLNGAMNPQRINQAEISLIERINQIDLTHLWDDHDQPSVF